ncbi:MAG: AI-2E family transporter YdiK [Burkholderiaceae bacterium]|nr:AI-2E family transporter YdiK [Burkholderiaceae bacterium]
MTQPRSDLARSTLGVLIIGGLILAAFWVLRPFIGPAIWATTIVVATWPLMLRLQALLLHRRSLAVLVMTLVLLLVFVLPIVLAVITLVENVDEIVAAGRRLAGLRISTPPDWVVGLPLVGPKLQALWLQLVAAGGEGLVAKVLPYAGEATKWVASQVGSVGVLVVNAMLVVGLSALMYAEGEVAAAMLIRVGRRLAGAAGEAVVVLAGQAIRGVAMGVGVTALVQSVLGGLGLALTGVPYAGLLTVLMFMLCIAQLGPILVLAPAVAWLYWSGDPTWGTVLLVITLVVGTLDNFLRPFLIRMGADLPLLLIFSGVIGGLLAFGLVGIFIGPVVLAVCYRLMQAWVAEGQRPDA